LIWPGLLKGIRKSKKVYDEWGNEFLEPITNLLGITPFVFFYNCSDFTDSAVFPLEALFRSLPAQIGPLNFDPVLRSTKVGRVVQDKISFLELLP
jgi:hypothetical protein